MIMSDDELDRIKKKQLDDLLKHQQEQQAVQETPVIDLNSSNFDDALSKNKLLLVDFWAEWCGPCKSMHPIFSRMAKKYGRIRFARVNIDNSQDIAMKLKMFNQFPHLSCSKMEKLFSRWLVRLENQEFI